eukprot:CAMPEP_0174323522 /NCGR_PEP_ID=MMETSP0810-20121108/11871_1 /TAXON_ID=73025 ORGANISM="Eutreptiella gymnastica-like, Strain CCMP1594" /NCGR_SAMPLE_ID=MMETSP0810 /ASSEMBLY_ACC=CAM_ASM_000659 /LENGTH=77 /DNA_ID=CAMNT_0015435993 /DNA_START=962 /DNA_END=1195 /DNA_ORIENTATION=+
MPLSWALWAMHDALHGTGPADVGVPFAKKKNATPLRRRLAAVRGTGTRIVQAMLGTRVAMHMNRAVVHGAPVMQHAQ